MTYLSRYLAGEHREVWADLRALGAGVRDEPVAADAWEVALETMSRVLRNLRRLELRLAGLGYEFGVYPDGETPSWFEGALAPPSPGTPRDVETLRGLAGSIPLSLEAFWSVVGSVDFVGRRPGWPSGLDPIVVGPAAGALEEWENWDAWREEDGEEEVGPFIAPIAPDALHKDNVSGGEPYGLALPNPAADGRLENEAHGLMFVEYLRLAILEWGGLPGLPDTRDPPPELRALAEGLEPF
jgi:hypothetical protein